jgi:hypothetical protein
MATDQPLGLADAASPGQVLQHSGSLLAGRVRAEHWGALALGEAIAAGATAVDGACKADLAVYIPSTSTFVYLPSKGGKDVMTSFSPTGVGAVAVPGDFDGDGKAVYVPGLSTFSYRPSHGGKDVIVQFGSAGRSIPIPRPPAYSQLPVGSTSLPRLATLVGSSALRRPHP